MRARRWSRCSRLDVIPIINENDTVTTDEIRFGDNDTLGALVTNLIEADVLVLLTDQQGLFTADPRRDPAATLVRTAQAGDPRLEAMAGGAGSAVGRGGMLSKVLAAKRAARSGASTLIANGREENVLTRLAAGEDIGTSLVAPDVSLGARKQWLADHVQLAGRLTLDAGAVRALVRDGKSLLPIGVVARRRQFRARRDRRLLRSRRPRDRARPRQLQRARSRAHPAQAVVRNRGDTRLQSTSPN